jgi:nucleoid DNA-binding protein
VDTKDNSVKFDNDVLRTSRLRIAKSINSTSITKEKIACMLKDKLGLSNLICEEIVKQIFSNIQQMASKQRLTLVGFGSFCTSIKKPRPGINFHTKEAVIIPEKQVIRFIPAKKLKLLINKNAG